MAHLKADRARLAQIESEIDELEQKLQLLRTEKNTAQGRLDAFKYPVLTLPNEITSEIFVQVLPPYPRCPPVTGRSSPTALTHVCRKWRDIGLATPQLWRAISLRETSGDSEETRIEMEKITIWLDRSRACALSIRMEHWPDLFSGVYNHPEECYDALLPHRERWEHLQLNVHNRHLHLFDGLQPSLKSLSLKMEDYEQGRPAVSDLDFPRLEAVSISNFERPVDWLPWSQLKSLTLNEMHPHQYIPILQNSRHLVHLTLLCCHGHDPSVAELPFPRLQTLLIFRCNQTFTETFRMLITPVLRRLQLPDAVMGDDPIDTLSSFVSRSGCQLHTLFITEERTKDISKEAYRIAFPTIPKILFKSAYDWLGDRRERNIVESPDEVDLSREEDSSGEEDSSNQEDSDGDSDEEDSDD